VDSFVNEDNKKLVSEESIKKHYKGLCDYKKFNKKEEKEILKNYKSYLKDKNRRKDIILKYKTFRNILPEIIKKAQEKHLNYLKIFFDEDIEKYKKESEIYYAIKIFNDIKYSLKIENSVFGLSDSNMGLNQKKPFLANKTRKLPTPFMILKEDAFLVKKFFDWLKSQDLKNEYPLNSTLFINRDYKEKDLIIDFDNLPIIEDKLQNPILIKNYLLMKENSQLIETQIVEKISELENIIDEVFYNKQLKNNYFGEVFKKLDTSFANLIYLTRDAMINYFKKRDKKTFFEIVKRYGNSFVIEHLKNNRFFKASQSLNLKLSLLEYKKEKIVDIKSMQEKILKKLSDSDYVLLNKDDFFYLSGQVVKYLLAQSEANEKNADMLEPFLRANSVKKLKKDIETTYFKYKHKISLNNIKLNNAISLIMAYEGDEKLSNNMDDFLVGVLSDNIFFMKKEEK
jgi:CRISPR-associated protein Csh1